MKASELRSGNYVQTASGATIFRASFRYLADLENWPDNTISGVPLTHEILVQNKFNIGGPECVGIVYEMLEHPGYWEYKGAKIQYVHQLQNLYPFFAPDGMELQFKINHDHNHSQL